MTMTFTEWAVMIIGGAVVAFFGLLMLLGATIFVCVCVDNWKSRKSKKEEKL